MKWISWLYIYCIRILWYYFARPALWEFVKTMVHTAETQHKYQAKFNLSLWIASMPQVVMRDLAGLCYGQQWTYIKLHKATPSCTSVSAPPFWSISEFLYNEHVQKQCSLEFKGTSVQVFILYFQPTCFKVFTYRVFSSCDQIPYTRNKPPSWCTTCTVCY